MAAAIVKAWRDQNPESHISVMACTNIPVVKLVQETADTCGEEQLKAMKSLALFSAMAKDRYGEQIRDVERHTLINKIDAAAFINKLEPEEKKAVNEYRQNYLEHPIFSQEENLEEFTKLLNDLTSHFPLQQWQPTS